MMDIRYLGDPVLRTPADPVRDFGPALRTLVDRMFQAMYAADGVGLAAPQVGVGLRLFVYDVQDGRPGMVANPVLTVDDPAEQLDEEGCLSIPGHQYPTARPTAVAVTGQDTNGDAITVRGRDYLARCLQHETDHLDGRLYIDHLAKPLRREVLLNFHP
ncbi:MAG: peptide deformylase [Streptosporangiales bacterium]|nr:peptide deformylase [Streptosporangiales bacterium]